MKFLIIQENGRHDKNRNFRECFSLQRSIKKLNCECEVWGLGHVNFNTSPNFNEFDIIVNLENYDKIGWLPDLSKYTKAYKILWSIDAHVRGIKTYLSEYKRGKYNLILQATKDFVDNNSIWFPNCFDDELIFPKQVTKRADVGFCGNVVNRKAYLDFLGKQFNFISDIFVIGNDMVDAINSYKIHFNKNISNDINYRNFETIGCGISLITNQNPQYDELGFRDFENCIFYNSFEELQKKITFLLSNQAELEKISMGGLELSKRHTYIERTKYLLKVLENRGTK